MHTQHPSTALRRSGKVNLKHELNFEVAAPADARWLDVGIQNHPVDDDQQAAESISRGIPGLREQAVAWFTSSELGNDSAIWEFFSVATGGPVPDHQHYRFLGVLQMAGLNRAHAVYQVFVSRKPITSVDHEVEDDPVY